MSDVLLLLLATALINNVILVQFLGLCPYLGVSRQLSAAWGMSLATGLVLVVAAVLSFVIEHALLIPFGLTHIRTLAFILIIASTVQAIEIVMARASPLVYNALGIYLPLITTNCAVLGVALLSARTTDTLLEALVYGIGTAIGFGLVLCLFAAMREYIDESVVPELWRGAPIALVTAALMALGFLGLAGLDRGFGS
ncbi:MAG: RnfABCDGE type electron transport complex subunit A [Pseudomonadota bacterium]